MAFESGRRNQPWSRPVRNTSLRPGLQSGGECLMHGLFGEIQISEEADERRQNPAGFRSVKNLNGPAELFGHRRRHLRQTSKRSGSTQLHSGLTRKGDKITLWAAKPAHSCSTRGAKSDRRASRRPPMQPRSTAASTAGCTTNIICTRSSSPGDLSSPQRPSGANGAQRPGAEPVPLRRARARGRDRNGTGAGRRSQAERRRLRPGLVRGQPHSRHRSIALARHRLDPPVDGRHAAVRVPAHLRRDLSICRPRHDLRGVRLDGPGQHASDPHPGLHGRPAGQGALSELPTRLAIL
jgi:hypothetical protein